MADSQSPPDQIAPVQPKRVEDLWFTDANLILRAEGKLFRVYSQLLCARSPVFRDMVAFPQPATLEGETIDGHPVVLLHDSAAEVEVFLRALLDSNFFMPPPVTTIFNAVVGIMRLAHKYDVQYLFRRALSSLGTVYSPELRAFLHARRLFDNDAHHVHFSVEYPENIDTDILVLHATSQVGAVWLLPAIYYHICSRPSSEFLAAEGRGNCLDLPVASCTGSCVAAVSEAREVLLKESRIGSDDLDPLDDWAFSLTTNDLCPGCHRFGRAQYEAARYTLWNRLPEIFGLPSWQELEEKRRAVMDARA
ncbi:hypothetical protein DFH06DRAFT_1151277 [Mycena polygramma]|nr:hypothetical protein DFH06DRAFT_1151277 [Mycena polygramma]